MHKSLKIIFVTMMFAGVVFLLPAQEGSKIKTVVIDAGHGGKDPGALGRRSKEKDIALAVALKTGAYIEQYLPDVKVIYTRKSDRFIPLHERADIANKNDADFFLSIHCNAIGSVHVSGAETYIMGLHKNDQNLNVAMKENSAILFEENTDDTYGGFNVNSVESYIQFSLLQDVNLDQSSALAADIQKQFKDRVGRRDRGVRQAGFLVLWKTAMPGVLIELGYISNPAEENFLNSEDGQVFMASAIYRAFRDYKKEYEIENVQPKSLTKKETSVGNALNYRVQFFTSPLEIDLQDKRFKGIPDMQRYFHNGLFKYTSGKFGTMEEAKKQLPLLEGLGYTDAFVAPFEGNERISFDRARQLEKEK